MKQAWAHVAGVEYPDTTPGPPLKRGGRNAVKAEEQARILALRDERMSIRAIAEITGRSYPTVRRVLKTVGRAGCLPDVHGRGTPYTAAMRADCVQLAKRTSAAWAARAYGVSSRAVCAWMEAAGVPRRRCGNYTLAEAMRLPQQGRKIAAA